MKTELAIAVQRAVIRKRTAVIAFGLLVAVLSFHPTAGAEENCCERGVSTPPFQLPPGNQVDWSDHFASSFASPFHSFLPDVDCPVQVRLCLRAVEDYRLVGEVKPDGRTQIDHNGDLLGTFVARVRLIDPEHGDELLKESRQVSWTGALDEGMNHKIDWYEPSADARNETWINPVGDLVKDFSNISEIIYDYERKPQKCRVTLPEDSGDTVQAGKAVTVTLSNIIDHMGRPPQPWQRILVKVEKGTITNAEAKWGELYVFRAGKAATVEIQYRAPDACKPDKETITVFNTCVKKESNKSVKPGSEIGKKEFNIVCDQWDVKITYTEDLGGTYNPGGKTKITVKRSYSGTFKARVKLIKTSSTTATYESRDAEVQIHDNYNHHTAREECSWRGGFNGNKSGRVPIEVKFGLNTHNHTYHVGLGKWSGDGTTYTRGGNLFGTSQGCSGAWQLEISSIVLPRGWEKGEGPPSSRPWAPGQTSVTFQTSWDDYMTGIWPQGAVAPPPALSVMMPAAYGIVYHLLVYDWGKFPNMKIKKTLSWEITRPK
jgi:hypothetical protein